MLSNWTIEEAAEEVTYRETRLALALARGVAGHIARCERNLETAHFRVEALRRQEADGIVLADATEDGQVA